MTAITLTLIASAWLVCALMEAHHDTRTTIAPPGADRLEGSARHASSRRSPSAPHVARVERTTGTRLATPRLAAALVVLVVPVWAIGEAL